MNVCIKCGQLQQALAVYRSMQADGCAPNVVTYNTLIDVYGKTGQWSEALAVLGRMEVGRGGGGPALCGAGAGVCGTPAVAATPTYARRVGCLACV
jgi:pentatricopeptide repeat protein